MNERMGKRRGRDKRRKGRGGDRLEEEEEKMGKEGMIDQRKRREMGEGGEKNGTEEEKSIV